MSKSEMSEERASFDAETTEAAEATEVAETMEEKKKSSKKTKKSEPEKQLGIEESFRLLDELLKKLEDEDTPLEESFKLYEEGLSLIKNADRQIAKVEQKLRILSEEGAEAEGAYTEDTEL